MRKITRCKPLLGTYVEISLEGELLESELLELSESGYEEIARIEKLMSFRCESSELARINRQACKGSVEISEEMFEVLSLAMQLSVMSDGYYDLSVASCLVEAGLLPRVEGYPSAEGTWRDIELIGRQLAFRKPLLLDLGGIAKGYAVDRALRAFGKDLNVVVNAGGDIRMHPWREKVTDIRLPYMGRFVSIECPMQAPALATSASYFHEGENPIFSPLSRESIKDDHSITVFAESCMIADALTKVAFLAPNAMEIISNLGASVVIIDKSGSFVSAEEYAGKS